MCAPASSHKSSSPEFNFVGLKGALDSRFVPSYFERCFLKKKNLSGYICNEVVFIAGKEGTNY